MSEPEWFDNSKITAFRHCPRKYWYRYERNLVPKDHAEGGKAMLFGGAIHKGLELLYVSGSVDQACSAFRECFPTELEEGPYSVLVGTSLLETYAAKWFPEHFEVLAIEQSFQIPMGDFNFIGRMDLLAKANDRIFPVDHKTTSRWGVIFDNSFRVDGQFSGYIRANQRLHGEAAANFAMVDALRVTVRVTDESFARKFTNRTPTELDRWEADLLHSVEDIRRARTHRRWMKNAPVACFAYNRLCEYFRLCSHPGDPEELIDMDYMQLPWSPY